MSVVVPIVKKLGPKARPDVIKQLPITSSIVWLGFAFYIWSVLLSPYAPGDPIWQTKPETLMRLLHESSNFFYINDALHTVGLNPFPLVPEHPVDEAMFNLVGAWGLMFLPVMLSDRLSQKMKPRTRWGFWIGTWFLTNFFFIPYQAIRLEPRNRPEDDRPVVLPSWSALIAVISCTMGVISIGWGFFARPEFGDLSRRLSFAMEAFSNDRVFYAFCVDIVLFSFFQVVLLNKEATLSSYIPFFGLGLHLFYARQQQRN